MESKIILSIFVVIVFFVISIFFKLKSDRFKKKLHQLAKDLGLTYKEGDKDIYPSFKLKKNWLFIKNYNVSFTELDFSLKGLVAFSHLYGINFIKADYERGSIILKSSRAKSVSFSKNHPRNLNRFSAFIGIDENGGKFVLDTYDAPAFSIFGTMGLGKSTLVNRIRMSLIKTTGEAKSYIFTKNRNDWTSTFKTKIVHKDDKERLLSCLREIKDEMKEREKEIETAGHASAFHAGNQFDPIFVVADEVHSYGRLLDTTHTPEERKIQSEIISILNFIILQGRSSMVYIFLITPALEAEKTNLCMRDCHFCFSTKTRSETLANNIFGDSVAYLMPKERGLFAFGDMNGTKIVKVAGP